MAREKRKKPISVYFPVPKRIAKRIEDLRIEDDRSTNKFLCRLVASQIEKYKKKGEPIPVCEAEDEEVGEFVRLPQDLVVDVDTIAAQHDRTRTRMVRHMVVAEVNKDSR